MVRTRHKFNIIGKIVDTKSVDTLHFKVNSTTTIKRVVESLCENTQKECSEIKTIIIQYTTMTLSETYHISLTDLEQERSFRDLSLVGKKSIVITVKLDNFN